VTRRRWALAALALAGLAWALGGEWLSIHRGVPESHLLDLLGGLSLLLGGIVAMDRRPGNRIGPLMTAAGVCWFCGNWTNLGASVAVPVLYVANAVGDGLLAHFTLAYPGGRLGTRLERFTVALIYLVTAGSALGYALTFDARRAGCGSCPWQPVPFPNLAAAELFRRWNEQSAVVLVPLFVAVLYLRWRAASRARRRDLAPFWIASAILATAYLLEAFATGDPSRGFPYLLWELRAVLQICLPVVFVAGLLSTRLARSAVGDLVVGLRAPVPPGELRGLLAEALSDRSVEIAYRLDGADRWVGSDGSPVDLPEPGAGPARRQVTLVERDGRVLAALVHDPALDPELVRAVAAAAGMSIENERLHAEVRAQLDEVRASRARIVRAGDEQRRRVERDLHDGAQQRLLTLSLALRTARRQLSATTPGGSAALAGALDRAAEELRLAIEELRELARGIHPTILTDAGLGPALRSLAGRSPATVTVAALPDGRFPATVEATAYFVVSEALANVAKHAGGAAAAVRVDWRDGSLTVEVRDRGPGGADPARGSGLRGLQDRVAAAGGRLAVTSPPGGGTVLRAELPCGAPDLPDGAAPAAASELAGAGP
jgi:signal transduction histidine kinase